MKKNEGVATLNQASTSSLVVIDVQTRLTNALPYKVLMRLRRNFDLLLRAASLLSVPTFLTEQYPEGLGATEPELLALMPPNFTKFKKSCFAASNADGFLQALKSSKCTQVVLVGIESHICVLQTALKLIAEDYTVFVVADAIGSRSRENYETAIRRMERSGIIICDTESVIFEWLGDSGHKDFKALSMHIKHLDKDC